MMVALMRRQHVDRVDLARARPVLDARRPSVRESDDFTAMFRDKDEAVALQGHLRHLLAAPRAVVSEGVEHAVGHEAAVRGAPRVGAHALYRIGVVGHRDTHGHGANPRLGPAVLGDWATFFLALLLVPVLLLEESSSDPGVVWVATVTNVLIWLAFALDYVVDLWRTADRRTYIRAHWADLALIVVSPPLLAPPEAQALRVLRAFRLLRAFAVVGIIAERFGTPLTRRAALGILGVLAVVVLAGGVLIIVAEPRSFPTIAQGYAWAVATLVTAGHASPEPTTAAGRAISTLIVVMGLGSFAALAASLATVRS